MNIDYFCFSVPSLNTTDLIFKKSDDENVHLFKIKELELMQNAKRKHMLIVFNRQDKKFYDEFGRVDVKDKVIFPRSLIIYEQELLNALSSSLANTLETNEDALKIEKWPLYIKPLYREVIVTTFAEFRNNALKYKEYFKNIFIQTSKKSDIHFILKNYGYLDLGYKKMFISKPKINLRDDEQIFLSEAFKYVGDFNNIDSNIYRAFIINKELISIARCHLRYKCFIPEEVIFFVNDLLKQINEVKDFPSSYTLDVGEMIIDGKRVIDIIEFNSLCSSGLELGNNLVKEITRKKILKRR